MLFKTSAALLLAAASLPTHAGTLLHDDPTQLDTVIVTGARNLTDERSVGEFSGVTDARTASAAVFFPREGRSAFVGLRLTYR